MHSSRIRRSAALVFCAVFLFMSNPSVHAAEPTREQREFFDKKVRPLLEKNCFNCHSHAAGKSKGALMLDSATALLKGGETGPALVVGQPEKSLLIKAVEYDDTGLRMPPKGKLSDEQIGILKEWVKMGAPWSGDPTKTALRPRGTISDEDRSWWAFQPVKNYQPPTVGDEKGLMNPIDRFIRARLDAEGLKPAPMADRITLIRRVTFDLIGLPPTPDEVDAFVNDVRPDAYEKLVDRLLASPRYGERWARHWLDLARYAESDGFKADDYRPNAWRYRDYVVNAFNKDKPYDRFLREQLAGDELAADDPEALVATGFLRHTVYEYNQRNVPGQWSDILDDLTDTTGDVFLGLGMGCARCHNHKFDPILQKDYYRLRSYFAAIQPYDDLPLATAAQIKEYRAKQELWETKTAEIRAKIAALEAPIRAKLTKDAISKFPEDIQELLAKDDAKRTPLEKQLGALAYRQIQYELDRIDGKFKADVKQQILDLRKELASADADKPAALPIGLTVRDIGPLAPPMSIPKAKSGESIEPGILSVFDERPAVIAAPKDGSTTGRRTALADWLTRPDNPLTSRVIVNRLWQYHFGRGLAASSSDFGHLGEKPTHPELLDWLAGQFVRDGWSIKKMHRLMVTSATYKQSSLYPASAIALKNDPDNRFLGRMSSHRLDAEQIRDALLAMSGKLDLKMAGPAVDPNQPRRTLYTKVRRNNRDPLLDVFDAPEGFVSTAAQCNDDADPVLLMINSPFMLAQARAFSERLLKEKHDNDEALIEAAYRLTVGRAPTANEKREGADFLREQALRTPQKTGVNPQASALADFCHVLLNANEFLYLD